MDSSRHCPKILVVDDDPDQRELICESLRMHYGDGQGRRIIAVGSGRECLDQDLESFDVVLQDYNLRDMPGLTLIQEILSRVDLPIILVTGENVSSTAAQAIKYGVQDYILKLGDFLFALPVMVEKNISQHRVKKQNLQLQRELQGMLTELRVKNMQLQESMEKLQEMATTDHLTGLANRRQFGEILDRSFHEATRYGFDLACCMCDLDHYKHFNDSRGHQEGDRLLQAAAEIVRLSLRASDIAARYGGDEFVLLLPHTSLDRAMSVADRIREELQACTTRYEGLAHEVTVSIGVASLPADRPTSADALVSLADRALYEAKARGRNRVVAFSHLSSTPQTAAS